MPSFPATSGKSAIVSKAVGRNRKGTEPARLKFKPTEVFSLETSI
jgi:hypothetical protein